MDSLTIELVSNASRELFPDKTLSFFYKLFTRASKLGGPKGGGNFRNILPINVPKYNRGESQVFFIRNFQNLRQPTVSNLVYTLPTHIVEAMNTLIQERNNHNETCITVKVSRRTKKVVIMLANDSSRLAFCSNDLGHIFGNNVGNEFGVLMIEKGPHEPEIA